MTPALWRTALFATLANLAFAANSILCRGALDSGSIDPVSFLSIRLASGAVMLLLVSRWMDRIRPESGSWTGAVVLMLFGIPFSFAYGGLSAGTGALILSGVIQITMMMAALAAGERPRPIQWVGLVIALAGLVYLVLPGVEAPPLFSAVLMAVAGVAWGVYSLLGRSRDPLALTTGIFVRCVPLTLALTLATLSRAHADTSGVLMAVASGAVGSGLGYVAWYEALRGLTTTRAAAVQLAVPIMAALGDVLLLSEPFSMRFLLASVVVLGGVGLTLRGRSRVPSVASP